MEPAPTHADFIRTLDAREMLWGVNGFLRGCAVVWGGSSTRFVFAVTSLAVGPMAAVAYIALAQWEPLLLLWLLPVAVAMLAGNPGPTMFGLVFWTVLSVAAAAVGAAVCAHHAVVECGTPVALWRSPAFLNFVPGMALLPLWFTSCAVKGAIMVSMEAELRRSEAAYGRLVAAGTLTWVRRVPTCEP